MSIPITDCLRCGVCCHGNLDTYVRVTGADWDRLGVDAERVAHFIGHRAYMRMRDGHCAALDVRVAADGNGREFFCTIYERRPQTCRDLGRGTPECEAELVRKGPVVVVAEAAAGLPPLRGGAAILPPDPDAQAATAPGRRGGV